MKAFVTGGTGYMGRPLTKRLVEEGLDVRVLVRDGAGAVGLPARVEVVRGDVRDEEALRRGMRGADVVFHGAALVRVWHPDPDLFFEVNFRGVQKMLRAAEEEKVGRVVYTSTVLALGSTSSAIHTERDHVRRSTFSTPYEESKYYGADAAWLAATRRFPIVIVYPGIVFGEPEPGASLSARPPADFVGNMIRDFLEGKTKGILGDGEQRWSFAYLPDVVEGQLAAWRRGKDGEDYILGGENLSLNEFYSALALVSGKPAPDRRVPLALARAAGLLQSIRAELFRRPPEYTAGVIEMLSRNWSFSSGKAERELGYRMTPFRDALQRTVEALQRPRQS